jgi:hypothetical protein
MWNILFWTQIILVSVITLIITIIACWTFFHAFRQLIFWPKVPARIMRYWITRSDGQRFYHPVVIFETVDGRSATAISPWGSWRKPWPIGHTVSIRYCPDNQRWIEINCIANMWGIPITFLFLLPICGLMIWSILK